MLCKYCGRLATSDSHCLICGASLDGTASNKHTPEQLAEYELAVKQREAEMQKAEQERIV